MNIKFLLPFAAAIAFVACSDDSSSTAPEQGPESSAVEPLSSEALPASSETVPASSASVGGIDPIPPAVDGPYDPSKEYVFYGAELTGKEQFKYGRFEARMKMAATSGSVSSMFLNYDLSWKKDIEPWNEIDIEILGKAPNSWQSNILTREADPSISGLTSSEQIHEFGFDATNEFHLYAIIWTPDYVAWEIDSVEVRRVSTFGLRSLRAGPASGLRKTSPSSSISTTCAFMPTMRIPRTSPSPGRMTSTVWRLITTAGPKATGKWNA